MTLDEQIAERIYVQMRRRRLTGVAAAKVLGIEQSTMSKKLNGTRPLAMAEVLSLCAWMDLPIGDVLSDLRVEGQGDVMAENRCTQAPDFHSASSQVRHAKKVAA